MDSALIVLGYWLLYGFGKYGICATYCPGLKYGERKKKEEIWKNRPSPLN